LAESGSHPRAPFDPPAPHWGVARVLRAHRHECGATVSDYTQIVCASLTADQRAEVLSYVYALLGVANEGSPRDEPGPWRDVLLALEDDLLYFGRRNERRLLDRLDPDVSSPFTVHGGQWGDDPVADATIPDEGA
jgi:hypothetical protein